LKRSPEKDVKQFWKKKEEDIGEKIKGKSMAEFNGGYQNFSGPILGILFYTESAFYFRQENRLNFRILWSDVEKIDVPPRKHPFLALLSPADYRIFIDYQSNGQKMTLTLNMHCPEDCSRLIDFYKDRKTKKKW